VLAVAFVLAVAAPERGPDGRHLAPGTEIHGSLQVGDCLTALDSDIAPRVDVVPCEMQHVGEVFAVFDVPDGTGPYPGRAELSRRVTDACTAQLAGYAPSAAREGDVDVFVYFPDVQHWNEAGGNYAECAVRHDQPVTGSIRGRWRRGLRL
jgi:hypothetical protein